MTRNILYKKLKNYRGLSSGPSGGDEVDLIRLFSSYGVPLTYSGEVPLVLYSSVEPTFVPCGVRIEVPDGYIGNVVNDYDSIKRNIIVPGTPWTTAGTSDCNKELCVPVMNVGVGIAYLHPGECLARYLVHQTMENDLGLVEDEEYVSAEPLVRTRTVRSSTSTSGGNVLYSVSET
jgi:dUTPase